MPFVEVVTNAVVENKALLARELTTVIMETMGKPVDHVMVEVRHSEGMAFKGTSDPCAIVKIKAFPASVAPVAQPMTAALGDKLGVAADRVFITFLAYDPSEWCVNGQQISSR